MSNDVFEKVKGLMDSIKLPSNTGELLKNLEEVATSEGSMSDKLDKLKDKFIKTENKESEDNTESK